MENETMVGLNDNEVRIFIELRRIAMTSGTVSLNYDKWGKVQSIDEYHRRKLSTVTDYGNFDENKKSAIL